MDEWEHPHSCSFYGNQTFYHKCRHHKQPVTLLANEIRIDMSLDCNLKSSADRKE